MVIGMVKDKDIFKVLKQLPVDAYYFFCQATIPRAMDAEELYRQAIGLGLKGEVIRSVNEALSEAKRRAKETDMIFIGASTFVVAEINEL
jgi:dihydrofolate synthase/folylpolyglutamate synthase